MRVLAVDPGSRVSGWALIDDEGKVEASGAVKATRLELMAQRLDELFFGAGIDWRYPVLVVERTPKTSKVPRDFYMPGVAAGLWIMAWWTHAHFDGDPVLVRAGDWQRPMLGKRRTKETSKARAIAEAGRDIDDDNEADAICLGVWWWMTHREAR